MKEKRLHGFSFGAGHDVEVFSNPKELHFVVKENDEVVVEVSADYKLLFLMVTDEMMKNDPEDVNFQPKNESLL
jgi:hypothetical protein